MQGLTLGILGLGTVGSGVVKILRQNREVLERRVGIPLSIARRPSEPRRSKPSC